MKLILAKLCTPQYELRVSEFEYVAYTPLTGNLDKTFTWVCDLSSVDASGLASVGLNMDPSLFSYVTSITVNLEYVPNRDRYGIGLPAGGCPPAPTDPTTGGYVDADATTSLSSTVSSFDSGGCGNAVWHPAASAAQQVAVRYLCMDVSKLNVQSLSCMRVDMQLGSPTAQFQTNIGARLTYITAADYASSYKPIS